MIALILVMAFQVPTPPGKCQFRFCGRDQLLTMPPQESCEEVITTNPPEKAVTDRMIDWSQFSPKVSVPYECVPEVKK